MSMSLRVTNPGLAVVCVIDVNEKLNSLSAFLNIFRLLHDIYEKDTKEYLHFKKIYDRSIIFLSTMTNKKVSGKFLDYLVSQNIESFNFWTKLNNDDEVVIINKLDPKFVNLFDVSECEINDALGLMDVIGNSITINKDHSIELSSKTLIKGTSPFILLINVIMGISNNHNSNDPVMMSIINVANAMQALNLTSIDIDIIPDNLIDVLVVNKVETREFWINLNNERKSFLNEALLKIHSN